MFLHAKSVQSMNNSPGVAFRFEKFGNVERWTRIQTLKSMNKRHHGYLLRGHVTIIDELSNQIFSELSVWCVEAHKTYLTPYIEAL